FSKLRLLTFSGSSAAPAGRLSILAEDCDAGRSIVITVKTSRSAPANSWGVRVALLLSMLTRQLGSADDAIYCPAQFSRRSSILPSFKDWHHRAPAFRENVGQGHHRGLRSSAHGG